MSKKQRNGSGDIKYFTTAQMCERNHCCRATLDRWVKQGLIPPPVATHVGRENRYVQSQVFAFEKKRDPKVMRNDDEEFTGLPIAEIVEKKRMEKYLETQQRLDDERAAKAAVLAASKEKEHKVRERMQDLLPQEPEIIATKLTTSRRKK